MNPKLSADHLRRRAIVYIRQSKPEQVIHHQESKLRQYSLADQARAMGFVEVVTIDEDLGRSACGLVERPGFQRLVAEVCSGVVGAVFCIEASRLARNGREWHYLIEMCGMVGTILVDPDGVYDPSIINDRLLLGVKGTMSEFELSLFRQRSQAALEQKAQRGELRFILAIGYCWAQNKIEKDPDQRVRQAIDLVFRKMVELGSVRQVLRWFREENVCLPSLPRNSSEQVVWKLPTYSAIHGILTNPIYAGAYVFGRYESRTSIVNGQARKTQGHLKEQSAWKVLIRDHHEGYISWVDYERNQAKLAENAHMKSCAEPKAGRGGRALLSGLLRCRRCGQMLQTSYAGHTGRNGRYVCRGMSVEHGAKTCIGFGAGRPDAEVGRVILDSIGGNAVEAALQAAEQQREQQREQRRALELAAEQAHYEARLAARRYDAVDPDQRLVAAELEVRWNVALQKKVELEDKLKEFDRTSQSTPLPDERVLISLAQDVPKIWNSPSTDMRLKQRIVRILIHEIVADVEDTKNEIVLVIHWAGGRHSEHRIQKPLTGRHGRCTSLEAIEVLRKMAGKYSDEQIASTLNRLGLQTGGGNGWNEMRVRSARHYHELPALNPSLSNNETVTMMEAAERLSVSPSFVRRLIQEGSLPATQVVSCAPWEIPVEALHSESVRQAVRNMKDGLRTPRFENNENQTSIFSER